MADVRPRLMPVLCPGLPTALAEQVAALGLCAPHLEQLATLREETLMETAEWAVLRYTEPTQAF